MNWQGNLEVKIKLNEPLKKHTTFKIGGPAKIFIKPKDSNDLKLLLKRLKRYKISPLVIGAGSNILVSDKGVNKAVLQLNSPYFKKITVHENNIEVGAGCFLNKLIIRAKRHGISGLEFLAGIPGTVGGALVMNAGAWGKNIADSVATVTVMGYNGNIKTLNKEDIGFGYRTSGLTKYIILKTRLRGMRKNKSAIQHAIKEFLNYRKENQDLSKPSAGCVFKNPRGYSAGRLIDLCGLKGKKIGSACISQKHANFIVNEGNAKTRDILALMDLVKREVKKKFNIVLIPEIKIWQ